MSIYHHPRIVTDGLVLHLDAANKKSYPGSGTTWYDLSKNKYIGTMSNVSFDSNNGGSMSFNGTSSYISTNVGSPGSTPITFDFWINSNSSSPVGIYDSAPNTANVLRNYYFGIGGGYVEWWDRSPGVAMGITASSWTHVCVVYRFSTNRYIDYYRNGILISTGTGNTTSTIGWTSLRIGDINNGSAGRYSGKISIFKVYKTALTSDHVNQNFNATKSRYGL